MCWLIIFFCMQCWLFEGWRWSSTTWPSLPRSLTQNSSQKKSVPFILEKMSTDSASKTIPEKQQDRCDGLITISWWTFILGALMFGAAGIFSAYSKYQNQSSGYGLQTSSYSDVIILHRSYRISQKYVELLLHQLDSPCDLNQSLVPKHPFKALERQVAISIQAELLTAVAEFEKTEKNCASLKSLLSTWHYVSSFNKEGKANFANICPAQAQTMSLYLNYWQSQCI